MSFVISFKEFAKDPIKAVLFVTLIAISYLYHDTTSNFKKTIERDEKQIQRLQDRVDTLENKLLQINHSL